MGLISLMVECWNRRLQDWWLRLMRGWNLSTDQSNIYIYRSSFWDAVHCAHRNYASANMGGLYHIGRPYAFVTFMHILMSFIEKRKSLQLLYQFLVEPLEFLLIGCCLGFAYSMGSLRKCKFVIWRWTFNVCIYIFMKFSMEKWVSFLFGQAARDWRWSFNV